MTKRIAESERALADEMRSRLSGAPVGYRDGDRVVPVAYDLDVQQLVSEHDHASRDRIARTVMAMHPRQAAHAQHVSDACINRYIHAQQSDDGVGISFMTRSERDVASMEWGKRLRELIEAGKRKSKARELSILVDCDED